MTLLPIFFVNIYEIRICESVVMCIEDTFSFNFTPKQDAIE